MCWPIRSSAPRPPWPEEEAAVIRADAAVSNAEAKLRNLIGDPSLLAGLGRELIPCQSPCRVPFQPDLTDAMRKALCHRPEIQQATKEVRSASVRAEVAEKDLLPVLNLVLETYVSGLQGNSQVFPAWVDQFNTGRPTYGAGLQFEMPWGNRAAKARLQQRRLELRQTINQLQVVTANIRTEVEVAVRNVLTAYREIVSQYHTVAADEAEIQCLWDRWRLLADDQAMAGVVLDELLGAQERLSTDEFELANAEVCYHTDLIELNRVTGLLLATENVTEIQTVENNLPTVLLTKDVPQTEQLDRVYSIPAAPTAPPPAHHHRSRCTLAVGCAIGHAVANPINTTALHVLNHMRMLPPMQSVWQWFRPQSSAVKAADWREVEAIHDHVAHYRRTSNAQLAGHLDTFRQQVPRG